jgi:zinc protease
VTGGARSGSGKKSSGRAAPEVRAGAQVTEHRLRNGLRVLVAERHSDPVVAVMLFYGAGGRNELEQEAGVSHFLEHMMFKGTGALGKGEVDRLTTQLGGANNAFTSNDHTAYWFELASDRWEAALQIEADRMRGLLLDPVEFDAEREVVLEELSMTEDDPWRRLSRAVQTALFPRHPYGRPVIGFEDTLRGMTPESMRDYYTRFYHPSNATLVVSGDVTERAALKAVRAHFGAIDAGPAPEEADRWRPALSEPEGERRAEIRWDDSARRVCMAWPTEHVGSDADWELDVVSTVLTSGRLSRLQRSLVLDRSLAVSISTSNDTRVDSGVFWLFAQCARDVEPERLEAAIDEELARLREEKVTPEELRRAKALLRAGEAFDSETVSDVAEELGSWAVDADWRLALSGGEHHRRITSAKLRACADRWLRPERRVVAWCLPREEAGA